MDTQKTTDARLIWVVFGAAIFSLLTIGIYWIVVPYLALTGGLGWAKPAAVGGTFGDFVGGVIGTILNFTGVILIYLTFRAQTQASNLQQFESTFFSLLSNQRDIVEKMSFTFKKRQVEPNRFATTLNYGPTNVEVEGKKFIQDTVLLLEEAISKMPDNLDVEGMKGFIRSRYDAIYGGKEDELDHYFRHLYHIVKYTHNALIDNKRKYIDIVQAQMSDNELFLAFCNGLSKYGEKFYPLMEEYQFVENVRNRGDKFEAYKRLLYPKTFTRNAFVNTTTAE